MAIGCSRLKPALRRPARKAAAEWKALGQRVEAAVLGIFGPIPCREEMRLPSSMQRRKKLGRITGGRSAIRHAPNPDKRERRMAAALMVKQGGDHQILQDQDCFHGREPGPIHLCPVHRRKNISDGLRRGVKGKYVNLHRLPTCLMSREGRMTKPVSRHSPSTH